MNLAAHIGEQAKIVNVNPTEAQKQAGNYRKGHIKVHGIDITIENPRGSTRSGTSPDGKKWKSKLPHHYGYIRRTEGGDGDHVDVFVGPHLKSGKVFVIDQHEPDSGLWDEHKCLLGFGSAKQAKNAYASAFSDNKGHRRIGHVKTMNIAQFRDWLSGDTTQPVARADGGAVNYDTALGPADEMAFKAWKMLHAPNDSGADYDLRGAYRSGESRDSAGHMTDRFKKPNHPTFSDQSQYAVGPERERAGHWEGDAFVPPALRASGGRARFAEGGAPSFEQTTEAPPFDQTEPVEDAGKMDAAVRGAKQGVTMNFGDEVSGAYAAGPKAPDVLKNHPMLNNPLVPVGRALIGAGRVAYDAATGADPEATKNYEAARDAERRATAAAKKNHPYIYAGSELAGAIPAMAAAPELGAVKALAPAAKGIAKFGAGALDAAFAGGQYGAMSGAGEGEGIADRAVKAATGLVSGIVGGGVAHTAGTAIGAAAQRYGAPVVQTVRGWFNNEGEAARRAGSALMADQRLIQEGKANGLTIQQWVAARQAGEPVTLADLGAANTQALLRSAANTSPDARAQLEKVIQDRFLKQTERVGDTVRGAIPGASGNARKTADELVAHYDAGRVPLYKQAYQQGDKPIMSPAMERMMGSDTFVGAMKRAISSGKDRDVAEGLGGFNPMVNVSPDGRIVFNQGAKGVPTYPNLQYWDQVKRELDDVASKAFRSGAKGEGDVASKMATILRGELDKQVPSYANARGLAADYFGESSALEAGRKLAGKKPVAEDVKQIMRQMKPDERNLFQEGYAADLAERVIGRMKDTQDVTKAMFNSPNERQLAAAIFGPGGMAMLKARMSLETIMDGARQAMGNSTTARQLIEAGLAGGALTGFQSGWDPTSMLQGAGAFAAARGAPKFFAPQAVEGVKHLIGKVDAKTAAKVAEMLTSDDPRILQKGFQMAAKSQAIMEGLRRVANRVALAGQTPARQPITEGVRALQGPTGARADEQEQRP